MAAFTDNEKKRLLEAAEGQRELHTYLLGINGQDGFCRLVERRMEDVTALEESHNKLSNKVHWVIGILIGASVVVGGSVGIPQLFG